MLRFKTIATISAKAKLQPVALSDTPKWSGQTFLAFLIQAADTSLSRYIRWMLDIKNVLVTNLIGTVSKVVAPGSHKPMSCSAWQGLLVRFRREALLVEKGFLAGLSYIMIPIPPLFVTVNFPLYLLMPFFLYALSSKKIVSSV
jgi:hypothetical protein